MLNSARLCKKVAKSRIAKSRIAKSQVAKSRVAKSQYAKSRIAKSQVAKSHLRKVSFRYRFRSRRGIFFKVGVFFCPEFNSVESQRDLLDRNPQKRSCL